MLILPRLVDIFPDTPIRIEHFHIEKHELCTPTIPIWNRGGTQLVFFYMKMLDLYGSVRKYVDQNVLNAAI